MPPSLEAPAIRPAGGRPAFFYRFCRAVARLYFMWYAPCKAVGLEKFPASGPCLVLSNHSSLLDPPLVGSMIAREMHSLGRDGLFRVPVLGWIIRNINSHPIRRDGVDREFIKLSMALMEAGWPLLLFPEGTRSEDGKLGEAHGGFGMILERVPGVPCVPVLIQGTHKSLGRGMIFPRPARLSLSVGDPFVMEPRREGEPRREFYQRCADAIQAAWKTML